MWIGLDVLLHQQILNNFIVNFLEMIKLQLK